MSNELLVIPTDGTPDDHIIEPESDEAMGLGFTGDLFDGYLWHKPKAIVISLIISKRPGQGHFRHLVHNILERGLDVHVPTPVGKMEAIVRHMGFVQAFEPDDYFGGTVEVWVKLASKERSGEPSRTAEGD